MYVVSAQNGHAAYGIQHFTVDSAADLKDIPCVTMGCTAYVIDAKKRYIYSDSQGWKIMASSGGSEGGSSSGEEYDAIPLAEIDSYFNED